MSSISKHSVLFFKSDLKTITGSGFLLDILRYYVFFCKSIFFFSAGGGMLIDPFRAGGMGSTGGDMFRPPPHPGQLPRLLSIIQSKQTPPITGHQTVVPAISSLQLHFFYLPWVDTPSK